MWAAYWRIRHRYIKTRPLLGERIECRRADVRIAIAAHGGGPLHVGKNVENVWAAILRFSRNFRQVERSQTHGCNSGPGLNELPAGNGLMRIGHICHPIY
jgi:hypothetical protein